MRIRFVPLLLVLIAATTVLISPPARVGAQPMKDGSPEALQARFEGTRVAEPVGATSVGGAGDRVGEVPYCQGDITTTAASVDLDTITIAHQTVCGSNPTTDAAWTTGITHIIWSIDLNGDGDEDYDVIYTNTSGLYATVYFTAGSAFTRACGATPVTDGYTTFGASFPASCIGTPAAVRIQAYMVWDENPNGSTCDCPYDVAPDSFGFSAPIARSDCSATKAGPGANTVPSGGQAFAPLSPAPIYDTRTGVGGTAGLPLGSNQTSTVRVTGVGGVPSTGVSAVVLNVTATAGTANSYLSVTPGGGAATSSVNFRAGQDVPNLVTVPVGADGNVRVYNNVGCVHVVLDVFGFYGTAGTSRFNAIEPSRLVDTRSGVGGVQGPLGADTTAAFHVGGRGGVPAGATAAVLNVTATEGTLFSFLAVSPLGGAATSNVNFVGGEDRPNLVTVPLASDGTVRIYNNQGAVHVIADVMGWYGTAGSLFTPVNPARIVDTRLGLGGQTGKLAPGQTALAQVGGVAAVPSNADAVLLNVTATEAVAPTFVAVTPNGGGATSNLNVPPFRDVANAAAVKVGSGGPFVRIFNAAAETHVILDISGWFAPA